MLSDTNDTQELANYLDGKPKVEVSPEMGDKDKNKNKEKYKDEKPEWADKKSDATNDYDYSDSPDEDDRNW